MSSVGLTILYMLSLRWLFGGKQTASTEQPKEPLLTKDEIQEAKNRETISKLFAGNHSKISDDFLPTLNELFARWQAFQKNLFMNASPHSQRLCKKLMQDPWASPYKAKIVSELPGDIGDYKMFIDNAFTEPFPSTSDMDTWALLCLVKSIMAWKGIDPEESKKFLFHAQMHFVNHEMILGVICVEIYVRK